MNDMRKKIWAIGGGKGGVGKSVVTLMLGSWLARLGAKVIMVDADLGGGNLHTLAEIRDPLYNLADFIHRRLDYLEDVITETSVENLKLICGTDDILGIANIKFLQKIRLFKNLERLDADIILIDLGAGTSFTAMDFFLYAPHKIVVMTPQVTSVQNAYGFIKSCLCRRLMRIFSGDHDALECITQSILPKEGEMMIDSMSELRVSLGKMGDGREETLSRCIDEMGVKLIVNMVRDNKERNVGKIIQTVSENYLEISTEYMGAIEYDPKLSKSINKMMRFIKAESDSVGSISFYDIADRIMKKAGINPSVHSLSAVSS